MDKRSQGEELYRKKFEEHGLSERFEFVRRIWESDHGRKMIVRCKTCGAEFSIWNDVFKGRQQNLYCKECGASSDGKNGIKARSPKVDEAMSYYVEGHSVLETANAFGFTKVDINNFVKLRGLTNGKCFRDARTEQLKRDAKKRLVESLEEKGFFYLSGYENKNSKISIRCCACWAEFVRTYEFIKKGNLICRRCEHEKTIQRTEERKAQRERERELKLELKQLQLELEKRFIPKLNPYEKLHEEFLNRSGICEICGKPYSVREYVNSCGLKQARNNGVCSKACRNVKLNRLGRESRKRLGVKDNHRHRARKYGCEYDSSVNLKKLIARDGLRCAICGGVCNLDDHGWTEYFGPMSPTIDHIIPMSKGGGHTWNNVQVAHAICNSEKGDRTEEVRT